MRGKIISNIILEMVKYYSGDTKRINHFLKVHSFARTIGKIENIDKDTQFILEIASVVHDIGIKVSEEKYNSSAGKYQEIEGPKIAENLLENLGIESGVISRVSYLVGHHHTYSNITGIDYQILVEADFLVNIFEEDIKEIKTIKEKYFKTKAGIAILNGLYSLKDEVKTEEVKKEEVEVKEAINVDEDRRSQISSSKEWANQSVFYHIYPLGFCGAPQFNDWGSEPVSRIKKVIEWIPHLKELGINSIYFGPLFESTEHGYDTADYYKIDRRLGTNQDFKEVCEELHKNDINVVVDGVFNHVGRDFWAFKDIQKNGQSSKYCGWFENLNFGGKSPMGDNFWYEAWEGHFNLVKLNLKNREVVDHILGAVETWINEFKIDGIRFDVAYCMDENFFKEINNFCKSKKEGFWLMGEMVHGDYSRLAKPGMLDSVTNYECYKGNYSSHNDKNYFEISYSLNRLFGNGGIYKNIHTYNFADNHDVNRLSSTLKNKDDINNVYTLMYTMPGIPSVYYGSEWGVEGVKANGSDAGIRPELNLADIKQNDTLNHIKKLGEIHSNLPVLYDGTYEQISVTNQQFAFKREKNGETAYILLNLSDSDYIFNFNVSGAAKLINLFDNKEIQINNSNISINVTKHNSMILKRI